MIAYSNLDEQLGIRWGGIVGYLDGGGRQLGVIRQRDAEIRQLIGGGSPDLGVADATSSFAGVRVDGSILDGGALEASSG